MDIKWLSSFALCYKQTEEEPIVNCCSMSLAACQEAKIPGDPIVRGSFASRGRMPKPAYRVPVFYLCPLASSKKRNRRSDVSRPRSLAIVFYFSSFSFSKIGAASLANWMLVSRSMSEKVRLNTSRPSF